MKRVLHVIGKMDRAGAETMVMNLYRSIDHSKLQFDFIVFTNEKGNFDDEISELGGRIFYIPGRNALKRMLALRKFLRDNPSYNIVHAHTLFSNAFHLYAAKLAGVKHRICHSHNTSDAGAERGKFISLLYQYIAKKVIRRYSTAFLACGKEAGTFLFPRDAEVLILPNSIDVEAYRLIASECKDYLNRTFSIPKSTLKIIQVGRMEKVKNHKFSIRLAERMKALKIDFVMLFLGQGSLKQELEMLVTNASLDNYILFAGLREDVPQIMAGADVMIMPSLFEGFPVVLVESQAMGLKALVSKGLSKEVDLNMGLVDFLPLERQEDWIEKLINSRQGDFSCYTDKSHLIERGFDIRSNAEYLQDFYKKMN
ncbi:glycosyltransferase [Desertivirga xinjiangensis]|uniref:glycosyltransferase n=1 Tax=Desertivirga xinjiangensis TaxID=539206 RepID=UPI00210E5DF3|nr:glycosyltransferase [Pedobacter xinjiangensis]